MKKVRLSHSIRLFLGSALVALLSLGGWIGLQIFFQSSPAETFTLPAIPVDPTYSGVNAADAPTASLTTKLPEAESASSFSEPASPTPDQAAEKTPEALATLQRDPTEASDPTKLIEPAAPLFRQTSATLDERETQPTHTLRDRLARDPWNENLLIVLADQLFSTGNPTEAWELIARTGRLNDSRFASRILRFSLDAARADETLVILDSAGDTLPDFSAEDWLLLVRLHEETGQLDRAIEIADRRVSDRSELFRLRALQAQKAGKVDEAIFNQEQYLAHAAEASAGEWRNLSDWYESAGRHEEAVRASRQAERTNPPSVPTEP